jgi:hypothetical protein
MARIKLGLSSRRKILCDSYIFPDDYYDIPNVSQFEDLPAARQYATLQMKPYRNQDVDIYVNAGLSMELLLALQVAVKLNMNLRIMYYNLNKQIYIPQNVIWKSSISNCEYNNIYETFVLCLGRHNIDKPPLFKQISENEIFDFSLQENLAYSILSKCIGDNIQIYVTGLTQLMISTLNAAFKAQKKITFLHYNYDTEDYFPQIMN